MKSATVFIAVLCVAAVAVQSTKAMPAVEEEDDIEQFGQYAAEEQGRRQQQEEGSVFAKTLSQGEGLPETNNYDVLVQPMWCACRGRRCCSGRMIRASDDAVGTRNILNNWDRIRNGNGNRWRGGWKTNGRGNDNRRDVTDNELRITVLGSRTELLKLYSTQQDLAELYNSGVVRAELYERPLDKDTESVVAAALKGKQSAVVTTLSDGRRFLVVKGNQKGEGSETIAIIADHMTDDWVKVSTSTITRSTLGDFIKAGGFEYDPLLDNGRSAAMRMMILE